MFGLSFLYPLFLIGAAAIAIPVALHLFRRRTELVVDFPAVRLLQKAPVEQQRRRRLRELILLALRVGALLLLAFAFARPYMAQSAALTVAPITIVAMDTSMSVSAPGQFDRARQIAREAVQTAPVTHQVGLVTFADTATLVVPPTSDRGGVLAAIDAATPGAGGTRFRTALARAAEAVGAGEGRIIVVTDLQQAGWDTSDEGTVSERLAIEIKEVPPPAGNLAVTAVRRDGDAIVAAIHNYGSRQAAVPVRLRVDGRELVSTKLDVAPQTAAETRLVAAIPPRGGAEVSIDDAEGYAADNARFFILEPAAAIPVIVVTAEPPGTSTAGLYVERALQVAGEGRTFQTRVLDGRAFSALTPQEFGEPGAIAVLATRTLERKGRELIAAYLRGGGRVLATLGPDLDPATVRDTFGADLDVDDDTVASEGKTVTLLAVDTRHPIFRPFASPTGALGDVYVDQYRRLKDQSGRTVLARFSGGDPALVEQSVERGRLLIFTSDLDNRWNRFPLNPAFVPFAVETARYLTQGRELRQQWTLPEVPAGIKAAPGAYTLPAASGAGGQERRVAVNVDIKESNPARTTAEEFSAGIRRAAADVAARAASAAKDQEERQRLWQLGLLVMLAALTGESLLGRRTT